MSVRRLLVAAAVVVFAAAACSGSDDGSASSGESTAAPTSAVDSADPTESNPGAGADSVEVPAFEGVIDIEYVEDPTRCDPLDFRHCLLPFPSDFHSVADPDTDTGIRLDFAPEAMPANAEGVRVDPSAWNRADGFSPGSPMAFHLPGVDLEASGAPALTDLAQSLDPDSPIVVLDATTGERVPFWAELDSTEVPEPGISPGLVVVRPAVNFADGHRIVVAARNLVNAADGSVLEPLDTFETFVAYRDLLDTGDPRIESARERYERIFADLEAGGVERDDLQLAWDFTVASTRGLSETILAVRDDSFERLGDDAPIFEVASVEAHDDPGIASRVYGTFEMPNYLDGVGGPGERFVLGADGLPVVNDENPVFTADFQCIVPESAVAGGAGGAAAPARPVVYGHGLLGSEGEVASSSQRAMAAGHNMVYCATKWYGFSEEDVPNAIAILQDFSGFPTMADRSQQGIVAALWLARLMGHPDGLVSDPAFQTDDGSAAIDTSEVFFDSNSQGAIMGGAATAVSTEWTKAVLGVPGMNYSTLLRRSIDWDVYNAVLEPAYTDSVDRTLGIYFAQILWDRFEANGYANHMTDDPLPGSPEHRVLMHVAFGDHQVSMYAADVEARTIGASVHRPSVADGRLPDVEPQWGLSATQYPSSGSVLVVWDSGAPTPPTGNTAPRDGADPHGDPRAFADAQRQKSEFLDSDGLIVDVCGAAPCEAPPDE